MEEYTRPPEENDLLALCAELNRLEAKYLVIGGLAMNIHGLIRATDDVDFLIEDSLENQARVKEALKILPERAIEELGDDDIRDYTVVRVNDEITVDIMTSACGVGYEQAKSEIKTKTLNGVAVPYASRQLMIQTKQGFREKDKADLSYLKSLPEDQH